jgi:hypothetical protein
MESLRKVVGKGRAPFPPCSRCQATGCLWDQIAGKPICPDCQELLALGEGEPLVEPTRPTRCAACRHVGTVCYLTYPLHASDPIEIDLCPRHFHALLERRLDRAAFEQIGRQLHALGLTAQQVFLLHEAFYDEHGRPLQPVTEPY